VLGANAEQIAAHVEFGRAEPVVCERWRAGQSASLRCGAEALADAEKLVVTLGDQPLITPAAVGWLASQPAPSRALYNGQPGHPVVLGRDQLDAVRELRGDLGARDLLSGAHLIECTHICDGRDVDTPNDLEAIRNEPRAVI
jgi:molybdenum cofactor cytidylyltransferase